MFLSRVELRPEAAHNPEFWANLADVYRVHQTLWSLFSDSPDRKRDFLFRHEGEGGRSRFTTLSARAPSDGRGLWKVESKAFEPKLRAGQTLAFKLRVSPVHRSKAGEGAGKRHDLVMEEKRRLKAAGKPVFEPAVVQKQGAAWLAQREERYGFRLLRSDDGGEAGLQVRVDGYRQHGARKGVQFSTVDIEGLLEVRDPEAFLKAVYAGIGPAKAFGCGLMLVRPA